MRGRTVSGTAWRRCRSISPQPIPFGRWRTSGWVNSTRVAKAREDFKLYFLVGEPTVAELRPAFESALSILGKSSVEQEIVLEGKASEMSERLAAEVREHEQIPGAD